MNKWWQRRSYLKLFFKYPKVTNISTHRHCNNDSHHVSSRKEFAMNLHLHSMRVTVQPCSRSDLLQGTTI